MAEFNICLAGCVIGVEVMDPRLEQYCKQYLCDGPADFKVKTERSDLAFEQAKADRDNLRCGNPVIKYGDAYMELLALYRRIVEKILSYDAMLFHGSAIAVDGIGSLFTATSGTGKSTHTALWLDLFPESFILNDDKPVLQPRKDGVTVWGTPFAGKTDLQVNRGVPLKAICFLKQGSENQIRRLDETEALARMLNNTWRPNTGCGMERLLDLMQMILAQRPMYEMTCTTQLEAAQLSYKVMKGM